MKNIVYFDLETQKSFDEVGGRTEKHLRDLRMSIAVTYSSRDQAYRIFHEGTVQELVRELRGADLIVGHNIVSFDYTVLSAYTVFDFTQVPTLDTLVDLMKTLNFRLKLDAIARATVGSTKTAEGLEAIAWWRKGDPESILKIAEYCAYDVKLTRLIHEYGQRHGRIFYFDRMGQKRAVKVSW